MKHVKLFESWMESANSLDISKFAGDVSTEDESVFVFQVEDSMYAVLADKQTVMELYQMGTKVAELDSIIIKAHLFNTPGTSFIGFNLNDGIPFTEDTTVEEIGDEASVVFSLSDSADQLGDPDAEPQYYFFPLKRGAVTRLYQGTTLDVISIDDFVDDMNNIVEDFS